MMRLYRSRWSASGMNTIKVLLPHDVVVQAAVKELKKQVK